MFRLITAFGLTLMTSSTAILAESFKCGSTRGFSPYEITTLPGFDHRRFGPSEADMFKDFGVYVASFDSADDDNGDGVPDYRAVPEWVAYQINGVVPVEGEFEEPNISIHRPGDWYKSPEFTFLWDKRSEVRKKRIDNSYDGIGTVWNRGHLAMADHAQRYAQTSTEELDAASATEISWQASCNTHVFWNAVPQAATMNQGPWLHLENYTAALSNKVGNVWVIAGPVFDDQKEILYIGDPGEIPVAIPHALFKVLIIEQNGKIDARAFVFSQDAEIRPDGKPRPSDHEANNWVKCSSAESQGHFYDHGEKLKTLEEIEVLTGLNISFSHPDLENLKSNEFTELWDVEPEFWSGFICGGQKYVRKAAE